MNLQAEQRNRSRTPLCCLFLCVFSLLLLSCASSSSQETPSEQRKDAFSFETFQMLLSKNEYDFEGKTVTVSRMKRSPANMRSFYLSESKEEVLHGYRVFELYLSLYQAALYSHGKVIAMSFFIWNDPKFEIMASGTYKDSNEFEGTFLRSIYSEKAAYLAIFTYANGALKEVKDFKGKTIISNVISDGKIVDGYDLIFVYDRRPYDMKANKIVDGKVVETVSATTLYTDQERLASGAVLDEAIKTNSKGAERKYVLDPTLKDQPSTKLLGKFFDARTLALKDGTWKSTPVSDVKRVVEGGITRLADSSGNYFDGIVNIELYDNFFVCMEIKKGVPDGFCVGYYLVPNLIKLSIGLMKDGKPYDGSFFYLYEDGTILCWNLCYKNGRFEKITGLGAHWSAFVNKYNENGDLIDGYDLARIEAPDKIYLKKYENGVPGAEVPIDIFKNIHVPQLEMNCFNSMRASAKAAKEGRRD